MKRVMLDTNIYGEMLLDPDIEKLKPAIKGAKLVIYGNMLVRKELRATKRDAAFYDGNLRIHLVSLYDDLVGNKEYEITEEMRMTADAYYNAYREFGGSKSKSSIHDDFLIVACATAHGMDIVVSEDEKSMVTENAVRAYGLANSIYKRRTPQFIGYEEFKQILGS